MEDIEKKAPVQSISRAAAVLRCFEEHNELGLTEISRMVGLHKSTTAGIVNSLKLERFLDQSSETGKFRLGIELFRLNASVRSELRRICLPFIDSLLERFGETVNLAVLDGADIVYIDKRESAHSMRICTSIGQRIPVYCTANGKAMAAYLSREATDRIIASTKFVPYTGNTICSADRLLRELALVRELGFAKDNEEFESGLVCISAPIFGNNGEPVAALSLSGPSTRMTEKACSDIIAAITSDAGEITAQLTK